MPAFIAPKLGDLFKKRPLSRTPEPDPYADDDGCDGRLTLKSSKHDLFYGCTRYPQCCGTLGASPHAGSC